MDSALGKLARMISRSSRVTPNLLLKERLLPPDCCWVGSGGFWERRMMFLAPRRSI
jgi:hypothetical protein